MPRRRALRVATVALVGAAAPGMSAGRALASASQPTGAGQVTCRPGEKKFSCPVTIGTENSVCYPANDPYYAYDCGCSTGHAVCARRETCPVERQHCGPCCPPGQVCNTLLEKCMCKQGERCGSDCCKKNETCKNGKCCPNSRACGSNCCSAGKTCAFAGKSRVCCPSNRTVQRKIAGKQTRFCCPSGTVGVTFVSYGKGYSGCCPPGQFDCCDKNRNSVPDPDELEPLDPYVGRTFCVRGKPKKL